MENMGGNVLMNLSIEGKLPTWNQGCLKCGKKGGNKIKCTNCNTYGCREKIV
jgi:hypothetical protein